MGQQLYPTIKEASRKRINQNYVHHSQVIMKIFAALLLVFTVATVHCSPLQQSPQDLQGFADFIAKVRAIFAKFVAEGSDFVCSAKLHELLDILGLPDDLDGAVEMAQKWLCGSDEALLMKRSSEMELAALQGFIETIKAIWEKLKAYSVDQVCTSKLQELLDILGLPDALDGAVKMAQDLICGNVALGSSISEVGPFQGEFINTLKNILAALRAYGKNLVCTSKLQELMDILGLPDALDGTVKMAQNLICGSSALEKRNVQDLQGFADFIAKVRAIFATFVEKGSDFVCSAKLHDLLDTLGLPDDLDGAVEMAQKWLCGSDEALLMKRSSETELAALQGFIETIKAIWEQLKAYSVDQVCTSKLQELLDILGLPDALDGAVKMAQDLICGNVALGSPKNEVAAFRDTFIEMVMKIWTKLQAYSVDLVCTSKLQELMDILGLPDQLDGAVKMAQDLIC